MAEPKKKIIITKKKKIIKKSAASKPVKAVKEVDSDQESEAAETAQPKAPAVAVKSKGKKKVQVGKKKVQVTKKKVIKKPAQEAPPPEVVSTSEIESESSAPERQKTMITKPPIGAPSHEDEPEEEKANESFKFYCIRCGQKLEAYYDWVGRSIGCPRCKANIKIPEPLV